MQTVVKNLRVALLQFKVGKNKGENVAKACEFIRSAVAEHSPKVIALPECFNCPYGTKYFGEYAEAVPTGETCQTLSSIARELGIYLIGGTIPERAVDAQSKEKLYNTCTIWSPSGDLIGTYRKIHLFDINIPGGIKFMESDVLSPGDSFTVFEVDNAKIGIGICYDLRFEELARIYRNRGCDLIVYPAAFNMVTGPMHWELIQRGRANDNQLYIASISSARDPSGDYVAYGHSMVVDPWGKVMQSAKESEEIVVVDLDLNIVNQVRSQIPVSFQRRNDLYETVEK